jgi:hypothetical protein
MRRFVIGLAVAQMVLVLAAYGAGWAAASGPAIRASRAYNAHRVVGWAGLALAPLAPAAAGGLARRLARADEGAADRLRGKATVLAAGATVLALGTMTLGLLAEQRDWTGYWHLGAASALLTYSMGAGLVLLGGLRR